MVEGPAEEAVTRSEWPALGPESSSTTLLILLVDAVGGARGIGIEILNDETLGGGGGGVWEGGGGCSGGVAITGAGATLALSDINARGADGVDCNDRPSWATLGESKRSFRVMN